MSMIAESMAIKIQAHLAAVAQAQTIDAADAQQQSNNALIALCRGIIEEITENAETTVDGEQIL